MDNIVVYCHVGILSNVYSIMVAICSMCYIDERTICCYREKVLLVKTLAVSWEMAHTSTTNSVSM